MSNYSIAIIITNFFTIRKIISWMIAKSVAITFFTNINFFWFTFIIRIAGRNSTTNSESSYRINKTSRRINTPDRIRNIFGTNIIWINKSRSRVRRIFYFKNFLRTNFCFLTKTKITRALTAKTGLWISNPNFCRLSWPIL